MNPEALLKIINSRKLKPQQKLDVLKDILASVNVVQQPAGATVLAPVATVPAGVTVPVATPKPVIDHGKQLVPNDTLIICSACGKAPYKTVAPLYQHMTSEELCSAFTPPLTPETQLWADPYGNIAIDCPLCQLQKTVWILGKGNYDAVGDNAGYTVQSAGTPIPTKPREG